MGSKKSLEVLKRYKKSLLDECAIRIAKKRAEYQELIKQQEQLDIAFHDQGTSAGLWVDRQAFVARYQRDRKIFDEQIAVVQAAVQEEEKQLRKIFGEYQVFKSLVSRCEEEEKEQEKQKELKQLDDILTAYGGTTEDFVT